MHRACLGLLCGTDRYTLTILVAILGGGGLIVQALLAGGVAPALMQNITRGLVRIPSSCTHERVCIPNPSTLQAHTRPPCNHAVLNLRPGDAHWRPVVRMAP